MTLWLSSNLGHSPTSHWHDTNSFLLTTHMNISSTFDQATGLPHSKHGLTYYCLMYKSVPDVIYLSWLIRHAMAIGKKKKILWEYILSWVALPKRFKIKIRHTLMLSLTWWNNLIAQVYCICACSEHYTICLEATHTLRCEIRIFRTSWYRQHP